MCGFVGLYGASCNERALAQMRDAIAHRGPDDAGIWFSAKHQVGLGHRRLSIIDLSSAGHQPMATESNRLRIVYNGEVYNYQELRGRLEALGHRFRTASDTEVVLHAYQEWGTACFAAFRGMFAVALWDEERRELVLARDHTGIKPLFYYWDGRTFAFASELKAFDVLEGIDRSIDRSALFDYLTYLYIPTPKTAYKHIRKLPAAHVLVFDGARIEIKPYWDVPLAVDEDLDEHRAVARVRERLADAVRMNMVSDVPVGVFLSGGLDSSTVVANMSQAVERQVQSFTIGFDRQEHSETPYAAVVARRFQTDHHEHILEARDSIRDLLPRTVALYDEPFADGSAMPTLRVSELARHHVKVVLSGDGGDEVFAGYRWYSRWIRMQRVARRVPAALHWLLPGIGKLWPKHARGARVKHTLEGMAADPFTQYARLMELCSPQEKRALLGPDWASEFADYDDYWHLRAYWRPELDPITRLQYLDLKTYLPDDILTKVDRASMSVALEVRPPLLDPLLIEAVFAVPARIRFRNARRKYLMKRAVAPQLPREIVHRGKQGFSAPLMQWMAAEHAWAAQFLDSSAGVVRKDVVRNLSRHNWGAKYWAILVLEQWASKQRSLS